MRRQSRSRRRQRSPAAQVPRLSPSRMQSTARLLRDELGEVLPRFGCVLTNRGYHLDAILSPPLRQFARRRYTIGRACPRSSRVPKDSHLGQGLGRSVQRACGNHHFPAAPGVMGQGGAALGAERRGKASGRGQIVALHEFAAGDPFEIRGIDVDVRGVAGARGFATASAMTMRKPKKRPPHSVTDGPTQTAARQRFISHSLSAQTSRTHPVRGPSESQCG
jgi:hypothetical protein